jgi:acylpyruvate hydrolase
MKIFCVGRNYAEHARELNNEIPDKPVIFMKPATAILRNGQPFYYPEFSRDLHYEGEIVLRIGKNGKSIQPKFAMNYIDALTIGFDFTARDLQNELKAKGLPWELAKAFDGAAAVGEMVPTLGIEMNSLDILIKKNGQTVQKGNSAQLIFPFDKLIAFISQYFTIQKGDLIFTGTPAGVGSVKIGDILEGYLGEKLLISIPVK